MLTEATMANAVDREAEWLSAELEDFAPLLRAPGVAGVFDYIGARLRRVQQKPRQIHVYREKITETRESTADKRIQHDLMLGVLWPISNVERPDTREQLALDQAIERVMERLRGLPGDKTHGNRFWSAGETGEITGSPGIVVTMPDWRTATQPIDAPLGAGAAYVVEIRYPAIDFVVA